MLVTIGVDPHKGSHTAVAIDGEETKLAEVEVRSAKDQCDQLLGWAEAFPERRFAIESAAGLGHLLAQQLVAVGEEVLDVPATLAARVRVLGSGKASKNDPNDALSTAIAGLRHRRLRHVSGDDHVTVLRMLADRHHDLTALHTQAVCRLHALLANLSAGGLIWAAVGRSSGWPAALHSLCRRRGGGAPSPGPRPARRRAPPGP